MGDGPEHELLSKAGGRADGKKKTKKKMMMTMMQLCLQVVTLTLLPPYQLPPENHPK